jgi:hypothetical protein|tara:strand:- start:478 stop:1515 length:1038 start_codon:yes stop_codon:yes gene_type:complete
MALGTIDTNQIASEAVTVPKVTDQVLTNRNLVKNGAMIVAQRAASATGLGAANGYFTVDRMRMAIGDASAGRFTMAQTAVTDLSGFSKSVKISCTTADTSIAAGERLVLNYRFEGQDLQSLKSSSSSLKAFTVSFYARANAAFNLCSEIIFGADTSKNSQANQINALTTDWQRFTMSIPAATNTQIDDVTTHDTDLMFWMHAGSTYTSGSTSTTLRPNVNANRAAGVSSIFASTSNFVEITGIQLEVGDEATPFEHEDYGTTLAKCQRYYEVLPQHSGSFTVIAAYRASSDYRAQWIFKTEKRATPTMGGSFSATLTATYVSAQMASYYRTGDFYGGALTASAEL